MSEKASARPSQVTMAGWTAVIGSVLLVLTLFDAMSNLRTVEFRDSIDEFLSTPPGSGLGLEIGQVVEIMRVLMLFSGAAAAAAMVLAIYVLQRNRAARVGYTIAAVAIVLTAPAVGGFLPILIAFSAVMLWTRPARDWFAGRPVTAGSGGLFGSRPSARGRDGASLSSSEDRPDGEQAWPRMPEGSSDRPAPPPTEGFGTPGTQGQGRPGGGPSYGQGQSQGGPSSPQGGYPPPYGPPGQGPWPPPQYGQQYGPGYGQPPHGQQYGGPYYPQQYGYGYGPGGGGDKRPASVTTAAWVTWVLSVLTVLGFVMIAVVMVAARSQFLDRLRQDPTFQEMGVPADQVVAALWVLGTLAVFWSVAAMVLAWLAYRRVSWARITLVVSAVISGLLSLVAFPVGLLNALGAFAVVVLLFVGGANDWYSRRPAGGQGFPGPFQPYGQQQQRRPDEQQGQQRRPEEQQGQQRRPEEQQGQPAQPPAESSRGKDEPPSNVW
jgi:hypothetical protein